LGPAYQKFCVLYTMEACRPPPAAAVAANGLCGCACRLRLPWAAPARQGQGAGRRETELASQAWRSTKSSSCTAPRQVCDGSGAPAADQLAVQAFRRARCQRCGDGPLRALTDQQMTLRQGTATVALEPRDGGGGCERRNNRYVGGSNETSNGIARPHAPEKWGAQGGVIIVTGECRSFLGRLKVGLIYERVNTSGH
jgi:hypothetical protein